MYSEVTVIVDGALDEVSIYHDETLMSDAISTLAEELQGTGLNWAIYVTFHSHSENVEDCSCVQYETDHRPYLSNHDFKES